LGDTGGLVNTHSRIELTQNLTNLLDGSVTLFERHIVPIVVEPLRGREVIAISATFNFKIREIAEICRLGIELLSGTSIRILFSTSGL